MTVGVAPLSPAALPSSHLLRDWLGPSLSGRFGEEKYMRTALFYAITQRVVIICQLPLNYHYSLRNSAEQCSSHLPRSESLKSRKRIIAYPYRESNHASSSAWPQSVMTVLSRLIVLLCNCRLLSRMRPAIRNLL